jgi:hypothetical protein
MHICRSYNSHFEDGVYVLQHLLMYMGLQNLDTERHETFHILVSKSNATNNITEYFNKNISCTQIQSLHEQRGLGVQCGT